MANTFKNREKLLRRMRRLPVEMRIEARKAMETNRVELAEAIRAAAPEDDGDLKDSVRSRDTSNGTRISASVTVGDETAFYARMVEFGTPLQTAQPFFYPVIRSRKKRLKSRLTRAARKGLKKALGNG